MTFSLGSPRSLVKYNDQSISAITDVGAGLKGDLVLIKEQTASSSATISFVDGTSDVDLDATYPIYLFEFINIHPATDGAGLTFNMSVDTGSNYNVTKTSTYFRPYHDEADTNTALAYKTDVDLAQATGFQSLGTPGNDNDQCISGKMWLFNPSSTTFVKHWMTTASHVAENDFLESHHTAGYGNTTSAVDAVQFKMSSGNIDAGTFKLYGIKDS